MSHPLNPLEILLELQRCGGLALAAGRLSRSPSALSKQIRLLEQETGQVLVEHASKPLRLTQAGIAYAEAARQMREHLRGAEDRSAALRGELGGSLRVTTSFLFGHAVLAAYVPLFRQRFPQLHVDVELSDVDPELPGSPFDLSIRHSKATGGSLIARPLGTNRVRVCGSPAYFERHGRPLSPEDLAKHPCLMFRCEGLDARWRFSRGARTLWVVPKGPVASNSDELLMSSMRAGDGLLPCFDWVVGRELQQGQLQSCLDDWQFSSEAFGDPELWAVYPHGKRGQAKIRLFVTGLIEFLRQPTADFGPWGAPAAAGELPLMSVV